MHHFYVGDLMATIWGKALAAYSALFGKTPNLEDFDSRIHFQKTIYALKLLGINFGDIHFTWFHRGPYSFEIAGKYPKNALDENSLTPNEKQTLEKNKVPLKEQLKEPRNAELFSSVAYLVFEERLDDADVVHRMGLVKPWFTEEEIRQAISGVKQYFSPN